MRSLFLLFGVSLCAASGLNHSYPFIKRGYPDVGYCDSYKYTSLEYRQSLYEFSVKLYKTIGVRSNYHFIFSPYTIWMILAALAEGADPVIQQQIYQAHNFPTDGCTRQMYYNKLNQLLNLDDGVKIEYSRTLVIDEYSKLNQFWSDYSFKNCKLGVTYSSIKRYPQRSSDFMRQLMKAPLRRLNLDGNSVILDSIEYTGLWETAFADAMIQRSPFYNQIGQKIGSVDLMTMRKRVRMAYVPDMDMKIMELPVGHGGRYRIIFGLILAKTNNLIPYINELSTERIIKMLDDLKESYMPVEVAIPKFTITSEVDVKTLLEDIGLWSMWTDPATTKYVSEPAALPSSFIQRATLTLDSKGLTPAPAFGAPPINVFTGLDPRIGSDFIANRPFLFSMLDSETKSCIMTASYSQPTYAY